MKKLINFLFPEYYTSFAKVVRAYSVGEHKEIFIRDDNPTQPLIVTIPKKYIVVFRNRFGRGEVEVDEYTFNQAPYYKELPITWRESRFYSDTIRIKHIAFSIKHTNP
jgi:hypothetical protein